MRVAILTTETLHHAHFVRELAAAGLELSCVLETTGYKAPFDVAHEYETRRDAYEAEHWRPTPIPTLVDRVLSVPSANSEETLNFIDGAELVVVFGTGKLKGPLLERFRIVNLHGGDPQHYRGLDSHLWAIYHRDFANLVTTLHVLDAVLDNGPILDVRAIPIVRDMQLHQLRAANTEVCVQLVLDHCRAPQPPRAQTAIGRYYSAMPAVLKAVCERQFEAYTRSL